MKHKQINLSLYTEDYKKTQKFFTTVRVFTIFYSFVVSLGFIIFFVYSLTIMGQINALSQKKNELLTNIQARKQNEATMIYLSKKLGLVDQYLNADTKFIPYYAMLTSKVNNSTDGASLDSFVIDSSRTTSFTVIFRSKAEMLDYLRYVESGAFLQNFESLVLDNIASSGTRESPLTEYKLTFTGKFNPIDENSN